MKTPDIMQKEDLDPHVHALEQTTPIIMVRNLYKMYGSLRALNGINLDVYPGTVTALLGPNGAGKTTLVRILTTLLSFNEGQVSVGGYDVVARDHEVRSIIGLAGQSTAIDGYLTGKENLELVGRLYRLSKSEAQRRASILLDRFNLTHAGNRQVRTYSGGMRRRLDLAASLVGKPKILFLDEPTTGLDPRSRIGLWQIINQLVADGTTLLLTTQYLDEADYLADKIVVIDHGQIIAQGTSDQLKAQVGGDVLEFHVKDASLTQTAAHAVMSLGSDKPHIDEQSGIVTLPITGGTSVLPNVIRRLDAEKIELLDVILRRPTLDDVFLSLTGHQAEIVEENNKNHE